MTITILLADDHEIFRQGLQMLLSNQPAFQVVGQAVDGLEAVMMAEHLQPDVVIVDMMMPGLNGLEVICQIKQRLPNCYIIILSMYDDECYVFQALKNGASGYVLKESSTADLIEAVNAAVAGKRFLSPPLTERTIEAYIHEMENKRTGEYNVLTSREREVLLLSAQGLTSPEISKRLFISPRTVETHRANLMHKLDLHSQGQLTAYAREQGIIT
jgi:two-component system, NarL family, response regulator NreC